MIKLNPDKEYVKEIRQAIKENDGFCCCKLLKTIENKCPCLDFRENKEVEKWAEEMAKLYDEKSPDDYLRGQV